MIGIKTIIGKTRKEIDKYVCEFIAESIKIRNMITVEKDNNICMSLLLQDTYKCNMLLRYVGLVMLTDTENNWYEVDNKMMTYINTYLNCGGFKRKLVEMYNYYHNTFVTERNNLDYCKFLDKMINKSDKIDNTDKIHNTDKINELKRVIKMTENKIYGIINVNPIVKINKRRILHHEIRPLMNCDTEDDRYVVNLSYPNYLELIDRIDDPIVLNVIEDKHMSRCNEIMVDFTKLIVARQALAEELGFDTYFKYINRGKHDNSDTIKIFLSEMNNKICEKLKQDLTKIYNLHTNTVHKLNRCDILKYSRSKQNKTRFNVEHVVNIIFGILRDYFNIGVETTKLSGWNKNVHVYNFYDFDHKTKKNTDLLGRVFFDLAFSNTKHINDPMAIRLSDNMTINSITTLSEVALLGNYKKDIAYSDVITLFREFGYVINYLCYKSRVGLINYDFEFSNYIPSILECIAWDHDVISSITNNKDITNHIIMCRDLDLCYNIKIKCVNAKFDHLLHNSEPLLKIITDIFGTKGNAIDEIITTYKSIYSEAMEPVKHIVNIDIKHIDPFAIIHEINDTHSVLYANLMNEIFAFSTYWIIKNNFKSNNQIVVDFKKCILNNGVDNYRELIRIFFQNHSIDCFALYVSNVLKIDTNYDDDNDSNSDDNSFNYNVHPQSKYSNHSNNSNNSNKSLDPKKNRNNNNNNNNICDDSDREAIINFNR